MDNYLLMKKTQELEKLSSSLGFTKTYFIEDFIILKSKTKKELLKDIDRNINKNKFKDRIKHKKIVYLVPDEEMLRFALEKSKVDIFIGMEKINYKDSVHFVRGGLDQINCKIAFDKNKIFAISFADILNSSEKGKLLSRIIFNLQLYKKYNVNFLFNNFSSIKEEMRSAEDLKSILRVLQKK